MKHVLWDTCDEVNFMRDLERRGKLKTLFNYVITLDKRTFDGRGMAVEPDRVKGEAVRLLGDWVEKEGEADADVRRVLASVSY